MTQPIRLFRPPNSDAAEQAVIEVMRSGQIASGPYIDEFQRRFAQLIERPYVVCTSDMTHSLALALQLSNVGVNDEVLTLAFSCMASNSAIHLVGAKPVWVDIDPETATMSVSDLQNAITPRCKAVTVYHVAGYPAPIDQIADFCRERNLALIEDCNNALGATLNGTPLGQKSDFAIYSFYPNRQISALDGGALTCNSLATAERAAKLRRFGVDTSTFRDEFGEINPESDIPEVGWSTPFSNLNAAVGISQLPRAAVHMMRTRIIAEYMRLQLESVMGVTVIRPIKGANPAYWVLLILVEQRDHLLKVLKKQGIECSKLHFRNDIYTGFSALRRRLPGTDIFMTKVLAVPCGWWLTDEQVGKIVMAIRQAI